MKNKNLFKTVCSVFLAALIISATIFATRESKGIESNETSAIGRLLLISNIKLQAGAFGTAEGNGGFYYASYTPGTSRLLFPEMPAGSYKINICTPTGGVGGPVSGYSYQNKSFQYNGGEQTERVTLVQSGPCNVE